MTNSTLRSIFGRTLVIGFALAALSVASFGQSQYAALYDKSNNGHVGYAGVYGATVQVHWSTPGLITVISAPCTRESGGSSLCLATTYRNGKLEHQGEWKYFSSTEFGMRNTARWNVNGWEREYNDGWTFYQVR